MINDKNFESLNIFNPDVTVTMYGPQRQANYEPDAVVNVSRKPKFPFPCMMGDHPFPVEGFVCIVPNKFTLCKYHFTDMYKTIFDMLKLHYSDKSKDSY